MIKTYYSDVSQVTDNNNNNRHMYDHAIKSFINAAHMKEPKVIHQVFRMGWHPDHDDGSKLPERDEPSKTYDY